MSHHTQSPTEFLMVQVWGIVCEFLWIPKWCWSHCQGPVLWGPLFKAKPQWPVETAPVVLDQPIHLWWVWVTGSVSSPEKQPNGTNLPTDSAVISSTAVLCILWTQRNHSENIDLNIRHVCKQMPSRQHDQWKQALQSLQTTRQSCLWRLTHLLRSSSQKETIVQTLCFFNNSVNQGVHFTFNILYYATRTF